MPTTALYGSWTSPNSAELVASAGVSLDELVVDADTVYWLEGRPLGQDPGAEPRPITPEPDTPAGLRYADATLDPPVPGWCACANRTRAPRIFGFDLTEQIEPIVIRNL